MRLLIFCPIKVNSININKCIKDFLYSQNENLGTRILTQLVGMCFLKVVAATWTNRT